MTKTRSLCILHVDDDPRVRGVVRELLDEIVAGERLHIEGDDGSEVVGLFAEHRPDLVIMDFEMPKMDGLQATQALLLEHPGAKIVMLTMHDSTSVRAAAEKAGAMKLIPKDDLRSLGRIVQRFAG